MGRMLYNTLTVDERSLLDKGLNFCPTPGEPHMGDLHRDLDSFHRRLKIKIFFDPQNKVPFRLFGSDENCSVPVVYP